MVLVALAMVAIIAMAALSIDLVALYLAKEEAQRSADMAVLAAIRVLSLSGVTGDPNNVIGTLPRSPWPAACDLATQLAKAVANQNSVGGVAASTVNVSFVYNGISTADCSFAGGSGQFAVNPQVQVQVIRRGLPTMFSRIWSRNPNSVSATATGEAFNSSASGAIAPNGIVPVNPRCVKPWIIPNLDPVNVGAKFVNLNDGSIANPGIKLSGAGTGVIGESFTLTSDCKPGNPNCKGGDGLLDNPPSYNKQGANTLDYVPTLIQPTAVAYPTCADDSDYQKAIGGCDQSSVYACGIVGGGVQADLSFNPGQPSGDTSRATQCLIHQQGGQDVLDRSVFPFQIHAGSGNPVITSGVITSSTSIATVPIYDDTQVPVQFPIGVNQTPVTVVGFLQVFIDGVDSNGNLNVTVLNVAGCSNSALNPPVSGTSPVPIRLITPQ